jgi:DNA repair protein RecN (Recombination protein N)
VLLELKVSNFAIIENLHIQFQKGLNILTGETGAGKSVLLKSLSLLMGGKGSTESIRTGFQQASIEGSFDLAKRSDLKKKLQDLAIECEDDLLVVKRVLSEDKSRIYINGSLSTLNNLRDLVAPLIEVAGQTAPLIEMTGQFENRSLLSKTYHMDLLDQYAGIWQLRSSYTVLHAKWIKALQQIEELRANNQNAAQRLDFLSFQRDEIAALNLSEEKDGDLEIELKRLKNSSRIGAFVDAAENNLVADNDSATARLAMVLKKVQELAAFDGELVKQTEPLKEAQTLIEDAVYNLRKQADRLDGDPNRLEKLEERLSGIRKLQKKYGPDVKDILAALAEIEKEIALLSNVDSRLEDLQKEADALEKALRKEAKNLHSKRQAAAKLLSQSVNVELLDLNMKGVTFSVAVSELSELGASGMSEIEFMSQGSPKDPQRALAKFASGGELSRILLSLKRAIGTSHQPRTYLFDEVDTGVSGPTAEKVGKKLRAIAQGQQVICVTHLPQVAAFGDAHFFIQKSPLKTGVTMAVSELMKKDRVQEIARLISGEKITKTSLAHAEELLSSK